MHRLFGIAGAMLLSLVVLVPVAAAAEPWNDTRDILFTSGTTDRSSRARSAVVLNGTTTIHGDVEGLVILGGSADLVGGHAREVVAIGGRLGLYAGSAVDGDIRVVDTDLQQAAGAVVGGRIIDGIADVDWAAFTLVSASLLFILWLGLMLARSSWRSSPPGSSRQLRSRGPHHARARHVVRRRPGRCHRIAPGRWR
jgi:hypothetical protein